MEAHGPRPTNLNVTFEDGEWWYVGQADGGRRRVTGHNLKNTSRMFVNGKYVPKSHPLHKPGRYKSFDDAAFSALKGYSKTPKGHVYLIVNKAWNGWVKVGKAIDASDRLNSYQTSSPHRDYHLVHYIEVDDRASKERQAHNLIQKNAVERLGEWFRIPLGFAVQLLNSLAGDQQNAASSPEGTQ